jgi:hypothetical protein
MNMKLIVPSNLTEISLSKYQEYLKAFEQSKNEKNAETFLSLKILEIFCEITEEQSKQIQQDDANKVVKIIIDLLSQEPSLVESFMLDGITFGWVPKLDDLNFGEFLDLNNNITSWDNIVTAMGVLYRPVTEFTKDGKYNIEKYEGDKYHHLLKDMPISAVFGANVFFWNLGTDLVTATHKFLEKELKQMNLHQRHNLQQNGDGSVHYLNSLKTTLQKLKRY